VYQYSCVFCVIFLLFWASVSEGLTYLDVLSHCIIVLCCYSAKFLLTINSFIHSFTHIFACIVNVCERQRTACVDNDLKGQLYDYKVATIVLAVVAGLALICIIVLIRYFIVRQRTASEYNVAFFLSYTVHCYRALRDSRVL